MFDKIQEQAVRIAEQEHERRVEKKQRGDSAPPAPHWFNDPVLLKPRKEPLRSWAELAAPHLSRAQWMLMVEHCRETVTPFDGDIVRFFETAFEGLRLKDGSMIAA